MTVVAEQPAVETESRPTMTAPIPIPIVQPSPARPDDDGAAGRIDLVDLDCYYGEFRAVRDVTMSIRPHAVTAIIGPSGSGKSTVLRAINRLHEVNPSARVTGQVL